MVGAWHKVCVSVGESGLSRLLWEQEFAGSNPAARTIFDNAGRSGDQRGLITLFLAGSTPAPATIFTKEKRVKYVMHVHGKNVWQKREYTIEAVSELKARAQAEQMYRDDTNTPAITIEWAKFLMSVPR